MRRRLAFRLRRCRAPARTRRCGSWVRARASPLRWPAPSGCRSRRTTTSARRRCWRRWRLTGPRSGRRRCCRRRMCRCPRTSWWRRPTPRRGSWRRGTGCGSVRSAPGTARCGSRRRRPRRLTRGRTRTRALVSDRVDTQFAGSPATVAKHLRVLQDATDADELLVTTITYSHADRVRSFELLAREWGQA